MPSTSAEVFNISIDIDATDLTPVHHKYLLQISEGQSFSDQASFNAFCRMAITSWSSLNESTPLGSEAFFSHLERIEQKQSDTIPTPWGGVDICRYEHPDVEKFLVIKQGGYLAFEKHDQKNEHIIVREGFGILLYRKANDPTCWIKLLTAGEQASFIPGEEHCIIGLEDLLVYETSIDPRGMDQDLIFLFTPDTEP